MSGQNVTTAIGAQITELRSDVQTQITELRAEMQTPIKELQAQFTALRAEMNNLTKIIWTLVSLLFIPMLGLFYKILTS